MSKTGGVLDWRNSSTFQIRDYGWMQIELVEGLDTDLADAVDRAFPLVEE